MSQNIHEVTDTKGLVTLTQHPNGRFLVILKETNLVSEMNEQQTVIAALRKIMQDQYDSGMKALSVADEKVKKRLEGIQDVE